MFVVLRKNIIIVEFLYKVAAKFSPNVTLLNTSKCSMSPYSDLFK